MKKPFMAGYRTYDTSRGRGGPRQWRSAFHARMGMDEARGVVGDRSPHTILGVPGGATVAEIKSAYRKLARACHPDFCHVHGLPQAVATELFKKLTAAYTVLSGGAR